MAAWRVCMMKNGSPMTSAMFHIRETRLPECRGANQPTIAPTYPTSNKKQAHAWARWDGDIALSGKTSARSQRDRMPYGANAKMLGAREYRSQSRRQVGALSYSCQDIGRYTSGCGPFSFGW